MFISLCYLVLRRVLQLAVWRLRSNDLKELEIVVLRHELAILRRRTRRPATTWTDRLFLTAVSRLLPPARWRSFIITPGTLLRWHRHLVAKRWTYARRTGRPPLRREIRALVIRFARDNRQWGYQRIVGELKGLGTTDGVGRGTYPSSRSSGWCGSRVRLGGVIRFVNPTGRAHLLFLRETTLGSVGDVASPRDLNHNAASFRSLTALRQ